MLTLLLAVAVATFVAAAAVGPVSQPPVSTRYSHEQLQADANMTQQMSVPAASGPMADGRVVDDQLRHARDPGFVEELEAHQRGRRPDAGPRQEVRLPAAAAGTPPWRTATVRESRARRPVRPCRSSRRD